MTQFISHSRPVLPFHRSTFVGWVWPILAFIALCLLAGGGIALWAQVGGERGIAAVASSTDIEVGGIDVDVTADSAQEARKKGWQEAQRKAWAKAGGPKLPDGQLQSLVSAVVIERERLGPKRYIARLGVIFDRARAGRYLGGAAQARASAPMLLMPVTKNGGIYRVYETRNPWQRVWAEYQPGTSRIAYVRPSGAGGDSLLLTYGQTGRRSRLWWRNILDQFEAADVLIPVVELNHEWPGGPVKGTFTARYGPDSTYLDSFTLQADNDNDVPEMLEDGVRRMNDIFEQALVDGKLRPDPTLRVSSVGSADPALQRLIEIGRAILRQENAVQSEPTEEAGGSATPTPTPSATPETIVVSSYVVQFASPDAAAIDATVGAVRSAAGVRGAATTSMAIGGTSVMSVSYAGSLDQLAAALRARGFNVRQGNNALAISR